MHVVDVTLVINLDSIDINHILCLFSFFVGSGVANFSVVLCSDISELF